MTKGYNKEHSHMLQISITTKDCFTESDRVSATYSSPKKKKISSRGVRNSRKDHQSFFPPITNKTRIHQRQCKEGLSKKQDANRQLCSSPTTGIFLFAAKESFCSRARRSKRNVLKTSPNQPASNGAKTRKKAGKN